jgi:energy-coupling factor transport system ATP-binding protein
VADGVTFAYDPVRPILRGIDLRIGAGERVALVGPNGSGKSTLGRLLVGLLRADAGSVRLDGMDPSRLDARSLARHAGYVFQEPERQFLARTVRDEMLLGLTRPAAATVPALLEAFGLPLDRVGERSPFQLSGGEQRRLSLATVLVRRPATIVLDEPTFGQDRHGYDALLSIISEHVDAGATVIAATHDERLVADLATRVVTLDDGRVVGDERIAAASA